MISRRQVLVTGGAGLAAAAAASPAMGAVRREAGPALFLFDHSIRGAAVAAGRSGLPVAGFRKDVGVPWLEVIEPMWREKPLAIAGITHAGALFCLEQLGRHYGMGCTLRLPGATRLEAAAQSLLQAAADGPSIRRRPGAGVNAPVAWLMQPIARNHG